MAIHKYIKFTGDYSKLKSMGYEFQKLFANDYMQWSKNSGDEWSPTTRIWKKGAEVTMDRLTNYEGVFFELYMEYKANGKELPWHTSTTLGTHTWLRVITNNVDRTVSFDYNTYIEQERANHIAWDKDNDADTTHDLCSVVMDAKTLAALDELIALGWVELGTIEVQD